MRRESLTLVRWGAALGAFRVPSHRPRAIRVRRQVLLVSRLMSVMHERFNWYLALVDIQGLSGCNMERQRLLDKNVVGGPYLCEVRLAIDDTLSAVTAKRTYLDSK